MSVMLEGSKQPLAWHLAHKDACRLKLKISDGLSWTLYLELCAKTEARPSNGMRSEWAV